jgi:hypothetical protein
LKFRKWKSTHPWEKAKGAGNRYALKDYWTSWYLINILLQLLMVSQCPMLANDYYQFVSKSTSYPISSSTWEEVHEKIIKTESKYMSLFL